MEIILAVGCAIGLIGMLLRDKEIRELKREVSQMQVRDAVSQPQPVNYNGMWGVDYATGYCSPSRRPFTGHQHQHPWMRFYSPSRRPFTRLDVSEWDENEHTIDLGPLELPEPVRLSRGEEIAIHEALMTIDWEDVPVPERMVANALADQGLAWAFQHTPSPFCSVEGCFETMGVDTDGMCVTHWAAERGLPVVRIPVPNWPGLDADHDRD